MLGEFNEDGDEKTLYREDICLQTLFLLFKCSTKELFVSPANSSLVGILIAIGDVTDIVAIREQNFINLNTLSSGVHT